MIADALGTDGLSVSHLLRPLIAVGLVVVEPDPYAVDTRYALPETTPVIGEVS